MRETTHEAEIETQEDWLDDVPDSSESRDDIRKKAGEVAFEKQYEQASPEELETRADALKVELQEAQDTQKLYMTIGDLKGGKKMEGRVQFLKNEQNVVHRLLKSFDAIVVDTDTDLGPTMEKKAQDETRAVEQARGAEITARAKELEIKMKQEALKKEAQLKSLNETQARADKIGAEAKARHAEALAAVQDIKATRVKEPVRCSATTLKNLETRVQTQAAKEKNPLLSDQVISARTGQSSESLWSRMKDLFSKSVEPEVYRKDRERTGRINAKIEEFKAQQPQAPKERGVLGNLWYALSGKKRIDNRVAGYQKTFEILGNKPNYVEESAAYKVRSAKKETPPEETKAA